MSQHDFNIANQTFPSFRSDLNDALQASATMSAGSSAPTTPYAYQLWFDTTTDTWKVRNSGNTAWISTITTDLATGNVGIGITTPDAEPRLHVRKGDAGGVDSAINSVLTIENNTTAILQFLTPNTANQQIRFGDPQDTGAGFIQYNHSINAIQFGTNGPEKMRLDSSGALLINSTSANFGEYLKSHSATSYTFNSSRSGTGAEGHIVFRNGNGAVGTIFTNGTSTSYNTSSDYRLKENVVADWDATTRLKQLNPVRFNFISDADTTVDGFLAHEVSHDSEGNPLVPEAVTGTKDAMRDEEYEVTPAVLDDDGNEVTPAVMGTRSVPEYQGIDQSKLVPLLVKTIQELEARITALEAS